MRGIGAALVLGGVLVALAGCPSGNIIETRKTPNGEALILSADNRAILFDQRNNKTCAEPQPDAVRTIAHELAAALKGSAPIGGVNPELALAFSSAIRESAAELGKRTPTIQLMRDMLYRLCEAAMNGVFDPTSEGGKQLVLTIVKQIDNMAIALHAVDGLTGMGKVGRVVISATASGTTSASLSSGGSAPAGSLNAVVVPSEGEGLNKEAAEAIARALVEIVIITLEDANTYRVTDKWD